MRASGAGLIQLQMGRTDLHTERHPTDSFRVEPLEKSSQKHEKPCTQFGRKRRLAICIAGPLPGDMGEASVERMQSS